jgi:hypothetical protein
MTSTIDRLWIDNTRTHRYDYIKTVVRGSLSVEVETHECRGRGGAPRHGTSARRAHGPRHTHVAEHVPAHAHVTSYLLTYCLRISDKHGSLTRNKFLKCHYFEITWRIFKIRIEPRFQIDVCWLVKIQFDRRIDAWNWCPISRKISDKNSMMR